MTAQSESPEQRFARSGLQTPHRSATIPTGRMKLSFLLILGCLIVSGCRKQEPSAESARQDNPTSVRTVEVGLLTQGVVHDVFLRITNLHNSRCHLDHCIVSCECLHVDVQSFAIEPYASLPVRFRFDTRQTLPGSFQFRVDFRDKSGLDIQSFVFNLEVVEQLDDWVQLPIRESGDI